MLNMKKSSESFGFKGKKNWLFPIFSSLIAKMIGEIRLRTFKYVYYRNKQYMIMKKH
jgi:hypothetical protein